MLRFILLLSLVGISLQGGAKPQQNGGGNPIYQPDYSRGAGVQQPGHTGPLGAKSGGKYPQNPSQAYQQGPYGIGNGYGGQGVKAGKSGPGQYPQAAKQKPGYANRAGSFLGNVLGQGQGAKSPKAGYGAAGYPNIAAQGGYGNGAAGYPSNIGQQGYGGKPSKAGYGAGTFPQYAAQPQGYGAANYPQYGEQTGYGAGGYPQYGAQAGYGTNGGLYPGNFQQPGYGGKPPKAGYRNGYGGYPNAYQQQHQQQQQQHQQQQQQHQQQQQQQGIGGKPSKAGYGNGAALYQGGIGKPSKVASGYPSNVFPQQGIGAKPSKAGLFQQPYSNGVKSPLGAYQGPVGENAKLGAYGQQLPYRSQPDALGYDPKSAKTGAKSPYGAQAGYPDAANAKYAGAGQTSFNGQSVPQNPLEEEISPSAAVEGTQSMREGATTLPITPTSPSVLNPKPFKGGYQQLGAGQSAWTYAPEESAYTQNGYYENSYRAGCGGKC
ncbi:glycine-rich cell wall structural protein 1.8-like isoform X2 [Rana temporaria]|uniref:glycine-rich cell wall structural protein 1.8-like isoform X2 n=1 Tax=Rana temporaria TaxID=8407 RepID=UPI001AACDACB|nr:glycine-rich cell wall structural protein 1.8-like isoform X2 [Rana temporaria]